jgi:hypothetical protein
MKSIVGIVGLVAANNIAQVTKDLEKFSDMCCL